MTIVQSRNFPPEVRQALRRYDYEPLSRQLDPAANEVEFRLYRSQRIKQRRLNQDRETDHETA